MNYIAEYWRAIESGGVIVSERVKKQYWQNGRGKQTGNIYLTKNGQADP